MTADQIRSLQPALVALLQHFRPFFKREGTFKHWERYLLGLMADLKRKSIEPIALAAGVAVRTLQEFLAFFVWDHERVAAKLQQLIMDEHASSQAVGVIDASAHAKQGNKTPGVQRQWCGESGKIDNCVVGQHLLYTDNHPGNPFSCLLASDLYLPRSWDQDRPRCEQAKIPAQVLYRPKWRIAIEQVASAIGNGVRFNWLTFDEEYGGAAPFWFALDRLGQRGIGEARPNFRCWPRLPHCNSLQSAHASKQVNNVCRFSPLFTEQSFRRIKIQDTTRGPAVWEVKSARVHLAETSPKSHELSTPTDRLYWLILARQPVSGEIKYFISNASAGVEIEEMLTAAFARWQVEKWFERAKQEAGFGAFEVRTYTSLIRHWLCSAMVMYFLAAQTQRLRGEKSAYHAGAGCRRGQHVGVEDMASLAAVVR
jgi:SRSO17 transposase